jgi:PIN domain nuclease of toxin-antitoxin system
LLLDTRVLVDWMADSPRLDPRVRDRLASGGDEIFVGAASLWELATKIEGKQLEIPIQLAELERELDAQGFRIAPLTAAEIARTATLPPNIGNSFDRLLAAQAAALDAKLVTDDQRLRRLGVELF